MNPLQPPNRRTQPPWSSFYAVRMAHLARMRAAMRATAPSEPSEPTWDTLAAECGADAADALDILREEWSERQGHRDWMSRADLRRAVFARRLIERGTFSEGIPS